MLNKRTEPRLRAYLKCRHTNGLEMGLARELYQQLVENLIFDFIQMSPSHTTYECLDTMGKENQIPESGPLKMVNFYKLRNCCIIGLTTAIIVLLIEVSKNFRLLLRLSKKLLLLCLISSKQIFYYACTLCLKLWSIVDSFF